jgi:hypothetical protein
MKFREVAIAVTASCVGFACSGSDLPEELEYVDQFSVRLADEDLTTYRAIVNLSFFRDGGGTADLSFQVGETPVRTSLVLQPSLDQMRQRTFEVTLLNGSLVEGAGNWFVDGEFIGDGVVTVSLEDGGSLSGRSIDTTPEMEFSGKYTLGCFVPPSSLGRGEDSVPIPAQWDGNPRSLSLLGDSNLLSRECDEASRALGWR